MAAEKWRSKRGEAPAHLFNRLRQELVTVLTEGSWSQIEEDHKKVGLGWREDLKPGWGKPKYVERVLEEISNEELVAIARRALERFPERCAFTVVDTLHWMDAGGVASVTEVTRMAIAAVVEGVRLHPDQTPDDVLARFARSRQGRCGFRKL